MYLIDYWNEKVRKINIIDLKFIQATCIFFGLIIASLVPAVLDIYVWWFATLAILCLVRPFYTMFIKS